MNKIRLQTHDGSNNYLEELEGRPNEYRLVSPCYCFRCGYIPTNNGNREYIDPSGGPMIIIDNKLDCYGKKSYTVVNISHEKGIGYIITLKEDEQK